MIPYKVIGSDEALDEFRKGLAARNIATIAMDFEAECSLHVYGTFLCLIQVFDGRDYFIIDPFGTSEASLKGLLEDPGLVKLFYGADSDRSLVYKQHGIRMKAVYDLKALVDVLELEHRGLDMALNEILGIEVGKKKKYQMHNWTLRPIDGDALQYALSDVQYLFGLRAELEERVKAKGLEKELALMLARQESAPPANPVPAILRSREFKELNRLEKERFRRIYEAREGIAKRLNCPSSLVLPKEVLLLVAKSLGNIGMIRPGKRVSRQAIDELTASIRGIYEG